MLPFSNIQAVASPAYPTELLPKQETALKDLLFALNRRTESLFVVGSLACSLLPQLGGHGYGRLVPDIDIALECASMTVFRDIREALISTACYAADTQFEHRLHYHNGETFDFIPFGKIENKRRKVVWRTQSGKFVMNVIGFSDLLPHRHLATTTSGLMIPTIGIESQIAIKILSWNNRTRKKDAEDLLRLAIGLECPRQAEPFLDENPGAHGNLSNALGGVFQRTEMCGNYLASILKEDTLDVLRFATGDQERRAELITDMQKHVGTHIQSHFAARFTSALCDGLTRSSLPVGRG